MTLPTITIDGRVWLHEDDPLLPTLQRLATYRNPDYASAKAQGFSTHGIDPLLKMWVEERGQYGFPRAMVSGMPELRSRKVVDRTEAGEVHAIPNKIELREYQEPFIQDLLESFVSSGIVRGGVGQAEPGFGKTVCCAHLISVLSTKTIVLVHKENLKEQWRNRLKTFLGLRDDQIGDVQQDVCEWEGKPVVIALAQSLQAREYSREFYNSFGLVVVDECHRFAAPTFQEVIGLFPAKMRLGVSATVARRDGLEQVFHAHLGEVVAKGEGLRLKPRVALVQSPVVVTPAILKKLHRRNGRMDYVKMVTYLCEHEPRNRSIAKLVMRCVKEGRKVLLLSARRQHLETLQEIFLEFAQANQVPTTTALYMGGLSEEERQKAERKQVIFATFSMAEEGLDIPDLDTLVLTTPRRNVIQAAGRILRVHEGKKDPLLLDYQDETISMCRSLSRKRQATYRELGWLPRA